MTCQVSSTVVKRRVMPQDNSRTVYGVFIIASPVRRSPIFMEETRTCSGCGISHHRGTNNYAKSTSAPLIPHSPFRAENARTRPYLTKR